MPGRLAGDEPEHNEQDQQNRTDHEQGLSLEHERDGATGDQGRVERDAPGELHAGAANA